MVEPHCWPDAQLPQVRSAPHPSPASPHPMPSWTHVFGTHPEPTRGETHLDGAPGPPQRSPDPHVPQLAMTPPHPSPAGPHSMPCEAHVSGTQLLIT